IEIYEWRLEDLEGELKAIRKVIHTGVEPSDGHAVHIPLDKALERYDRIVEQIREGSDALANKKAARRQIETGLRGLNGIKFHVAYLRDIENLPLKVIADKLGYSYDHIRRISSKVRKINRR